MRRRTLHELVDRIPERDLSAAQRFLEYLAVNPACRAALSAPPDDEPVTESDAAAIAQAQEELRTGKVVPHDDPLREFPPGTSCEQWIVKQPFAFLQALTKYGDSVAAMSRR
jgi:hypothetical protein